MISLTVRFEIDSEFVQPFADAVRQQAHHSLEKEEGCERFDVCFLPEDPTQVFLYEVYRDQDAVDAHMQTEHFAEFSRTVEPWVRSKQVETWDLSQV